MLEIRLLGTFDLHQAGKPILLPSRPAQSLLAYLVLSAGTSHRREKLAGLLWPDSLEETARDNLRHALWRVRKALQSASSVSYLRANDLTIAFNASAEYWFDVATLEKTEESTSADELIAALSHYQGELLPGFYDEWVVLEREHLSSIYEHNMARLMALLQDENRWLDILEWGERWIKLGQKPEPAYRALMSAHAAKGEMSKVAATYERCVKSLYEFGVEPSEQTRKLYERLKAGKEYAETRKAIPTKEKHKEPTKTNLPVPLTSFVGREKEVAEVIHLLEKNRLLTLMGSGGVGKTRLAIQVSNKLMYKFKDGVWWIDLVGLTNETLVTQTLAQVIGVREIPNRPLMETLIEYMRSKQILLVLDNCEHVISVCAQFADQMLSRCNALKILTTSREALDILGETTWSVPSLSLPDPQEIVDISALNNYESIQLFIERTEVIQPQFKLTRQNAKALMQICRRLSGMPLAIELAAARVKMMTVEEIARRLDDRFNLLTAGNRTALPRHQTLRATIDWSYDLLSEVERIFFHRLSVFVNGFALNAAEVVSTGGSVRKSQVINLLGQLINKSLVSVEVHAENPSMETRYGMLETIREYARQKLAETGELGEVCDRHLGFFMRLAEEAQPEIFLSSQLAWLDLLEIELDNLRAAMEWSTTNEDIENNGVNQIGVGRQEAGLRLAAALAWFWERSYRHEAIERLKTMLTKMERLEPSPVHTKMFNAIGFLYWSAGEVGEARSYLEKAVLTGRELGKSLDLAWSLNYLGAVALAQDDQQTAQLSLDEAFEMAMELGSAGKHVIGWALAFLGDIPFLNRDFVIAQSFYEMSVIALGEVGNLNMKAYPLRRLGYLALYQNDHAGAAKFFKDSLMLNQELRHQLGMIGSVAAFGRLAIAEEFYVRSARLLGAVEANLEAIALTMLPSDRIEYSRSVTVLKEQLNKQVLTDAWADGRALTLEQAVIFALET